MLSAVLLAMATLPQSATPVIAHVPAPAHAHSGDRIRHLKGQPGLAGSATADAPRSVTTACHPDPMKGRICRHRVGKAEEAQNRLLARAEIAGSTQSAQ